MERNNLVRNGTVLHMVSFAYIWCKVPVWNGTGTYGVKYVHGHVHISMYGRGMNLNGTTRFSSVWFATER